MQENILISFKALDDENPEWLQLQSPYKLPTITTKSDELKPRAKTTRIFALIPSVGFACYTLDLKTSNRKKILQAAKYLLQDSVLDEVDELFLAIDKRSGSDLRVWVCKSELIESWLQHMQSLGLQPDFLLPDAFLMEPGFAEYSLWADEDDITLHDGLNFVTLNKNNLHQVLNSTITAEGNNLTTIEAHIFGDEIDLPEREDIKYEAVSYLEGSRLEALAKRLNLKYVFNLLQEKYAKPDDLLDKLKPWRLSAALLLIFGLLLVLSLGIDVYQLKQQDNALLDKMQKVYADVYPEEPNPDAPLRKMQEKVKGLKVGDKAQKHLSQLLSDMAPLLDNRIKISKISFANSKITIKVNAINIASLENMVDKIDKNRYNTKLVSAAQKDSGSEGVLDIEFL